MNRSFTISAKGGLVALVVVLGLAVAYLLGNAGSTAQAASSGGTTATAKPGTLTTIGTGSTYGVPDELSFSLSVGLVRPTLGEAMTAASAQMHAELAALGRLGVARQDVQTTGLSMNAVYAYHSYSPPTVTGYHVSQRAQVLVRSLAKGGQAVTVAVRTGGNDVRVGDLSLRVASTDALLARSRKAAVAEATAQARQYAADTGERLGQVVSLREVRTSAPGPRPLTFNGVAAGTKAAVPIRAGRDKLAVTVRIVWSLR